MEAKKKTLLLVEDEPVTAFLETKILEKEGYNVIVATCGEESIAIAQKNKSIDMILMDIELGPGIDGTESAQEILKNRRLPIVFLSSHTGPEILEKTRKVPVYGYITKGVGNKELVAAIEMAFKLYEASLVRHGYFMLVPCSPPEGYKI
jgi:CheY-like chemotaxis protein